MNMPSRTTLLFFRWKTEEIVWVLSREQRTMDDPCCNVYSGYIYLVQHSFGYTLRGLWVGFNVRLDCSVWHFLISCYWYVFLFFPHSVYFKGNYTWLLQLFILRILHQINLFHPEGISGKFQLQITDQYLNFKNNAVQSHFILPAYGSGIRSFSNRQWVFTTFAAMNIRGSVSKSLYLFLFCSVVYITCALSPWIDKYLRILWIKIQRNIRQSCATIYDDSTGQY